MTKEDFRNESGLGFTDISSEKDRKYVLSNGSTIEVPSPLFLSVSKSGGHRIVNANGVCWYINLKESWYIRWVTKEGQPHFVK